MSLVFSRRSGAVTAKKGTKNVSCSCIVVVFPNQPIGFLKFSLPSPSAHLKRPVAPNNSADY